MGEPNKKLKKVFIITGVTGAVYAIFRYLLPLVIPFLLGYWLAVGLRPNIDWIRKKWKWMPLGLLASVELLFLIVLLGLIAYFGGKKMLVEAIRLVEQLPLWIETLDIWLTDACREVELLLCLEQNTLVYLMREMLQGLFETVKGTAMTFMMSNSVLVFQIGFQVIIVLVVFFLATILSVQELGDWSDKCKKSLFKREIMMIANRMKMVTNAYLKTQGIIIMLTAIICMIGFWFMGNTYYLLAGLALGILDALPIFGTGTVLIPWAMILLAQGLWKKTLFIVVLYLICYFVREVLEAKLMGDKVGLSPIETLLVIYVGLQLFGLAGVLLGPIGLLLIKDLVHMLE